MPSITQRPRRGVVCDPPCLFSPPECFGEGMGMPSIIQRHFVGARSVTRPVFELAFFAFGFFGFGPCQNLRYIRFVGFRHRWRLRF